jgi:hypothetical protein
MAAFHSSAGQLQTDILNAPLWRIDEPEDRMRWQFSARYEVVFRCWGVEPKQPFSTAAELHERQSKHPRNFGHHDGSGHSEPMETHQLKRRHHKHEHAEEEHDGFFPGTDEEDERYARARGGRLEHFAHGGHYANQVKDDDDDDEEEIMEYPMRLMESMGRAIGPLVKMAGMAAAEERGGRTSKRRYANEAEEGHHANEAERGGRTSNRRK